MKLKNLQNAIKKCTVLKVIATPKTKNCSNILVISTNQKQEINRDSNCMKWKVATQRRSEPENNPLKCQKNVSHFLLVVFILW